MSFQGKKNRYTCDTCGQTVVTVDADEGTTPAMMACRANLQKDRRRDDGGCLGMMKSHWYPAGIKEPAVMEWYRPRTLAGLDDGSRQHVEMGGLLIRPAGTLRKAGGITRFRSRAKGRRPAPPSPTEEP